MSEDKPKTAKCLVCKESFEVPSEELLVTCPSCGRKFNRLGYVQPGAYLYAFVTVDEHGELVGVSTTTTELSPEEMRQIALKSLEDPGDESP